MSERFEWDVTVSRTGHVKVFAATENEAMVKANAVPNKGITWDDDFNATEAYCVDRVIEKMIFEVYTKGEVITTEAFQNLWKGYQAEENFDEFEQVARLAYQNEFGQNVLVELDVPTNPEYDTAYLCAYTYPGDLEDFTADDKIYDEVFEGKFEDIKEIMLKIAQNAFGVTIQEAIEDDGICFTDFYNALQQMELGNWDQINSSGIIYDYVNEKMREGILVSHILSAMESISSDEDLWSIWLGNSMETPEPINTKQDLVEALELTDSEMMFQIQVE